MINQTDAVKYYSERAKEYENVYSKPERKDELKKITITLQNIFRNKSLIEIACGTGYWTERISQTAKSVYAIDINDSVLEVAKSKSYSQNNVTFAKMDLYGMKLNEQYESLFGGFILSHIKWQEINNFMKIISEFVIPGGRIVLLDNNYVEGSSSPIIFTDEFGNTYQKRKLLDRSEHIIIKNFLTREYLFEVLKDRFTDIEFINMKYYWVLSFRIITTS